MIKKEEKINAVKKLKSFKKRSGWSYQKISVHMDVHAGAVYFWLVGKYLPSKMALEKINKFLIDFDY